MKPIFREDPYFCDDCLDISFPPQMLAKPESCFSILYLNRSNFQICHVKTYQWNAISTDLRIGDKKHCEEARRKQNTLNLIITSKIVESAKLLHKTGLW